MFLQTRECLLRESNSPHWIGLIRIESNNWWSSGPADVSVCPRPRTNNRCTCHTPAWANCSGNCFGSAAASKAVTRGHLRGRIGELDVDQHPAVVGHPGGGHRGRAVRAGDLPAGEAHRLRHERLGAIENAPASAEGGGLAGRLLPGVEDGNRLAALALLRGRGAEHARIELEHPGLGIRAGGVGPISATAIA